LISKLLLADVGVTGVSPPLAVAASVGELSPALVAAAVAAAAAAAAACCHFLLKNNNEELII